MSSMKITKFEHAAIVVQEQDVRILVDPTSMAEGWQDLTDLDGILVTHDHQDHVDGLGVAVLAKNNPGVAIFTDESAGKVLDSVDVEHKVVHGGDKFEIKGIPIEAVGDQHAPVHTALPPMSNVAYFINRRLFHPGDSFAKPNAPVEILALPTSGPWLKSQDVIDYMLSVKPQIAFPIHEALHSVPTIVHSMVQNFAVRNDIEWAEIPTGDTMEF